MLSISVSDCERINAVLGGTFVASDAGLYAEISVADIPSTNPLIILNGVIVISRTCKTKYISFIVFVTKLMMPFPKMIPAAIPNIVPISPIVNASSIISRNISPRVTPIERNKPISFCR